MPVAGQGVVSVLVKVLFGVLKVRCQFLAVLLWCCSQGAVVGAGEAVRWLKVRPKLLAVLAWLWVVGAGQGSSQGAGQGAVWCAQGGSWRC